MELTSASPIQLALATLFGASVMAISAFYIHKRSVDQVLDRLIKLRRKSSPSPADDANVPEIEADERTMNWHGVSSSTADTAVPNTDYSNPAVSSLLNNQLNFIPNDFPPLRTADQTDGISLSYFYVIYSILCA